MTDPRPGTRWAMVATAAFVLVAADQATKHWALNALSDGSTIDVVWTLQFNLAFNTGMSFSMGSGMGPVVAPLALLVVAGLLWMARQIISPAGLVGVGVVIGGVLGNLVDRAFRDGDGFLGGAVVDFIDLQWWPIFNIADMGIVLGAMLLVVATWREERAAAAQSDLAADGEERPDD
ncbi:MAG: signal peptidase II [Acidimicrobiales bacterium]